MTVAQALAAVAISAVGCALQGSVGFGLGMLGAPLLLLIDTRLVPGPVLLVSLALTLLMAHREWHAVRKADLAWSLPGRLLGTVIALGVLRLVPAERLDLLIASVLLGAVALSAVGPRLQLTPRTLFGAGTIAGFTGTTSSVGGPPMALIYQHEAGPSIRATLSSFFVVGTIISMAGLAIIGRFGWTEIKLALLMSPGVPVGFYISRHSARWLDDGWMRPAILASSALAGIIVILKDLL